jgi:16S rRNA (guanine527-N7)-methyltransferase
VVSRELAGRLAIYFELLAHWNQKVNLTGFGLDSPTDAAVDRLFIEPLLVARAVHPAPGKMIDIGSGGGSPGIPLSLALAPVQTVLVEVRTKKEVFLKEVARSLALSDRIHVQRARFADLAATDEFAGKFDLLTVRAVRIADEDLSALLAFLRPGGRLVLFGQGEEPSLRWARATSRVLVLPVVQTGRSNAVILRKS